MDRFTIICHKCGKDDIEIKTEWCYDSGDIYFVDMVCKTIGCDNIENLDTFIFP